MYRIPYEVCFCKIASLFKVLVVDEFYKEISFVLIYIEMNQIKSESFITLKQTFIYKKSHMFALCYFEDFYHTNTAQKHE